MVLDNPASLNNLKTQGDIASMVVPAGYEAHLFRDSNFRSGHRYFRGPTQVDQLPTPASSAIITKTATNNDEPGTNEAIIYHPGRNGLEGVILAAPLDVANVSKIGIPNNSIAQIKLGSNATLTGYDNYRFDGTQASFTGPYTGGLGVLDKKVSSFKLGQRETKTFQEITPVTAATSFLSNWGFWIVLIILILLLLWLWQSKKFQHRYPY